jgi:hypothetical protein
MNKYNAVTTVIDGIKFASGAEAQRYCELKLLQKAGEISGLKVHPRILLQPAFKHDGKTERKIEYEADFKYIKNGERIVEDVKGFATEVYKLKRKLLLYLYPQINFIQLNRK